MRLQVIAARRAEGERGIALLMALFVLAILSLVGLTYMTSSILETKINSNSRSSYPVFYAAEAGLEEATYRMKSTAINPINLTQLNAVTKVVYIRMNTGITPTSSSSLDYDTDYAGSNFSTVNYYTTNQGANPVPYRWVKISLKTKRLSGLDVDNAGITTNRDVPVYYDGAEYLYDPGNGINAAKAGFPVYLVTSFARTTDGAITKLRREIGKNEVPLYSAVQSALAATLGDGLNITGQIDPVCAAPDTYGIKSGSTITLVQNGNVSGSPAGKLANTPFPYDVPTMLSTLSPSASQIDAAGTGVTGSGSPVSYSGPHAVLGIAPTVTYNSNLNITAITTPGTPAMYYSNGNLTLGTSTLGGSAVSGQGVLLVNGT